MVKPCRKWIKKWGNEAEASALSSSKARDQGSDLDRHEEVPAPVWKRQAQAVMRQAVEKVRRVGNPEKGHWCSEASVRQQLREKETRET